MTSAREKESRTGNPDREKKSSHGHQGCTGSNGKAKNRNSPEARSIANRQSPIANDAARISLAIGYSERASGEFRKFRLKMGSSFVSI
jgi:hypothetical protein